MASLFNHGPRGFRHDSPLALLTATNHPRAGTLLGMTVWTFVQLLTGLALAASAGVLLVLALLRDRLGHPGRPRRCWRCRHDLTGVPGLTCTECGRKARGERELHRYRTDRRFILLALLVMLGAATSTLWTTVRIGEWFNFTPMWVRAALWPECNSTYLVQSQLLGPVLRSRPGPRMSALLRWSAARGSASPDPEMLETADWLLVAIGDRDAPTAQAAARLSAKSPQEVIKIDLLRAQTVADLIALCEKRKAAREHLPRTETRAATQRIAAAGLRPLVQAIGSSPGLIAGNGHVEDDVMLGLLDAAGTDTAKQDELVDAIIDFLPPRPFMYLETEFEQFPGYREMFARALQRVRDPVRRSVLGKLLAALNRIFDAPGYRQPQPLPGWAEPFCEALLDPDPRVRNDIARVLASTRGYSMVEHLAKTGARRPDDADACLRLIDARVRSRYEPLHREAVELTLRVLRADNPPAVEAAIELSRLFSPADTECLVALLDDPDPVVRTLAITALVGSQSARMSWIPRLVELSLDPAQPDHVRAEARRAALELSKGGPNVGH